MGLFGKVAGAVVKRLPPHGRDRAEAYLLPRRPFERLDLPRAAGLTIVCDDGEERDLDIAAMLERHQARGVFAVSPDCVGRPGFLGWDALRRLRDAGHEIAFHGSSHDAFTGFPGPDALDAAIVAGMRRLVAEGFDAPATLVYPSGRNNRWVRQVAASRFQRAFTTWFGLNDGDVNRFCIRRVAFGAYTGKQPSSEAWYRSMLERCAGSATWPVLMLHPGSGEHTSEHTALLGRLLEHARSLALPVRTAQAHLVSTDPASALAHRAAS